MDREESWQVIIGQRLSLADLLDELSDAEWDTPSLCQGWRVRDVAAHLAMAPQVPTLGWMIAQGVRARGSFHRLNHDVAVRHADTRPATQIVAELRQLAESRRLPVVTNYRNTLFDILIHGQDVAIPLGRKRDMPIEAARAGADRIWTMGWPFWAKRPRSTRCPSSSYARTMASPRTPKPARSRPARGRRRAPTRSESRR
jgi:uncharacterized protein (TIGR03083 family)